MPRDTRMVRLGRIVAAGFPHHVIQHGNRRQRIFFEPADDARYRGLLAKRRRKARREKRVTGKVSP
jgi:putative transposase